MTIGVYIERGAEGLAVKGHDEEVRLNRVLLLEAMEEGRVVFAFSLELGVHDDTLDLTFALSVDLDRRSFSEMFRSERRRG